MQMPRSFVRNWISIAHFGRRIVIDYTPTCLKKLCQCYFFEQLRETLVDFNYFWRATSRRKVTNDDDSFAHLTLVLLLYYLLKCRSCSLDVYKNEFILGTACRLKISLRDHKIVENLLLI